MKKKGVDRPDDISSRLSPLEEIRQEEARVASLALLARQEAEEEKKNCLLQALQLKEQARRDGTQAGQARYAAMIQEAAREAERIRDQAREQAESMTRAGNPSLLHKAASLAVNMVLGLDLEESDP